MNKKILAVIAVVVVAVVAAVAVYGGSGEGLKGSIKKKVQQPKTSVTVSLANGSPSGVKVQSPNDRVADFKVCNNTGNRLGIFGVSFEILYPQSGLRANSDNLPEPVSALKFNDVSMDEVGSNTYFTSERVDYYWDISLILEEFSCQTLSLYLDTQSLFDVGAFDDFLSISLNKLWFVDEGVLAPPHDTNLPVSSNVLKY